jgi:hypothetical protein
MRRRRLITHITPTPAQGKTKRLPNTQERHETRTRSKIPEQTQKYSRQVRRHTQELRHTGTQISQGTYRRRESMFDINRLRNSIEKIKALKSEERLPLLFAKESSLLGKILLDKEGNIVSNVASYYRVPYNAPDGGIAYRYVRKYPGCPIERVYNEMVNAGVLGGQAWKYADFSLAKFFFYVYSINPKPEEEKHGLHVFVLKNRTQIESFRVAISSLIPNDEENIDLDQVYRDVSRAFDPAHPNSGFSIAISRAANNKGLVLTVTQTNSIRGKSVELPDWYYETSLDTAWLDTSPDWKPTPEEMAEHEELAEQFRILALSGRLNPAAAERAYSQSVPVTEPPSRAVPVRPAAPASNPVPSAPSQPAPTTTPPARLKTAKDLKVRHAAPEEVPPFALSPDDPGAGGPNELVLRPDGVPVCFGNIKPDLPKCMKCPHLTECLTASE